MKRVFADGKVIGKIKISVKFDEETLDMKLETSAEAYETAEALQALGFSGEDGIDKTRAIAHEVAIGTHIEGALGIDRGSVEAGAKSANPNNPTQLKDVQEGKQIRPAAEIQKEVLEQTEEQQEEVQDFSQQEYFEQQQQQMKGGL